MARILIAERNEPIARLLQAAICRAVDCDTTKVHDPDAAAEALATQTFDLIVLDVGMYSEGLETLKHLKGRNEKTEIIALTTGVIRPPLMKTLTAADVAAIVTKPFDVTQLVALVVNTLRESHPDDPEGLLIYRKAGDEPTLE